MAIGKDDLKKQINNAFYYEVLELFQSKRFYQISVMNKKELDRNFNLFNNIAIEHAILHASNLFEFYTQNKDTEPRAVLYVKDWKSPPQTGNLKDFERKANNQIRHIGNLRHPFIQNEDWNIVGLVNQLLAITKDFLDQLPESWDEDNLKILRQKIDELIKIDYSQKEYKITFI